MLTKKCLKTKYTKVRERDSLVQGADPGFLDRGFKFEGGVDLRHLTVLPTFSQNSS